MHTKRTTGATIKTYFDLLISQLADRKFVEKILNF